MPDNTEDPEIEKILKILDKGGKIYLHPVDFQNMQMHCLRHGMFNLVQRIVENPIIPQGQMVVCATT